MLKKISVFFISAFLLFSCGAKIDYSAYTKAFIDCENGLSELKANVDILLQDSALKPEEKVSKALSILQNGVVSLKPRTQAIRDQASKLAASVSPNSKPSGDDKKANEEILKHIGLIQTSIGQIGQLIEGNPDLAGNAAIKTAFEALSADSKSIN